MLILKFLSSSSPNTDLSNITLSRFRSHATVSLTSKALYLPLKTANICTILLTVCEVIYGWGYFNTSLYESIFPMPSQSEAWLNLLENCRSQRFPSTGRGGGVDCRDMGPASCTSKPNNEILIPFVLEHADIIFILQISSAWKWAMHGLPLVDMCHIFLHICCASPLVVEANVRLLAYHREIVIFTLILVSSKLMWLSIHSFCLDSKYVFTYFISFTFLLKTIVYTAVEVAFCRMISYQSLAHCCSYISFMTHCVCNISTD